MSAARVPWWDKAYMAMGQGMLMPAEVGGTGQVTSLTGPSGITLLQPRGAISKTQGFGLLVGSKHSKRPVGMQPGGWDQEMAALP